MTREKKQEYDTKTRTVISIYITKLPIGRQELDASQINTNNMITMIL